MQRSRSFNQVTRIQILHHPSYLATNYVFGICQLRHVSIPSLTKHPYLNWRSTSRFILFINRITIRSTISWAAARARCFAINNILEKSPRTRFREVFIKRQVLARPWGKQRVAHFRPVISDQSAWCTGRPSQAPLSAGRLFPFSNPTSSNTESPCVLCFFGATMINDDLT